MKKLLLLLTFACFFLLTNAQDYKKLIQTPMLLKQPVLAKTEIDKLASDPKTQAKPETLIWKARVYAALYKDDSLRSKYPGSEVIASDAFQKYMKAEPDMKTIKANTDLENTVFDIYGTSFKQGIVTFNLKKWDSSLYYFSSSVIYSDIIYANKWTKDSTTSFDTTSILYAGYSAQNGKKVKEASEYYTRLIDKKVSGSAYLDMYKFVLVNYSDQKDSTNFYKYFAIAKQVFPKENWDEYELDFVNKAYNLGQKMAFYDKENAAGNLNALKYLHFGDMFVNPSKEEKTTMDSMTLINYRSKGREAFKKAYQLNNQDALAAFNIGVIYYNEYNNYDDKVIANTKALQELNANKPKVIDAKFKEKVDLLKKSRADFDKPALEAVDSAIAWIERSYTILNAKEKASRTSTEKNCYNRSVDYLANLYGSKRDKARGKDLKAYDVYDAKYKLYDSLHQ
jgi:hypothetical protein